MKPTENQIKLANAIADEIRFFGSTNDLHSPSHHTLIEEAVKLMLEVESENEVVNSREWLEQAILDIRDILIKNP